MKKTSLKLKTALAALTLVTLAACGGGGGATTAIAPTTPVNPTLPTIFTATTQCASGPALTSTLSQAAANARVPGDCPAVSTVGVGVSIAGNMLSVTGLPASLVVSSSSLTATSGASVVTYTNGALTSGTLLSAATYTYNGARVTLANAPAITLAGTFVSPAIATVCTAPAMLTTANTCISPPAATGYTWNSVVAGGVWVADIGVLVTGANLLSSASFVIGDTAWLQAMANGTIKCTNTSSTKADGRPEIFCHYKTVNGVINNGSEYYVSMPMMADTIATGGGANQSVGNGGSVNIATEFKGSVNGVKQKIPAFGCYEFAYNGANYTTNTLGSNGCSI